MIRIDPYHNPANLSVSMISYTFLIYPFRIILYPSCAVIASRRNVLQITQSITSGQTSPVTAQNVLRFAESLYPASLSATAATETISIHSAAIIPYAIKIFPIGYS